MIATVRRCFDILDPSMRARWLILVLFAIIAATLEMSGVAVIFGLINLVDNPATAAKAPLLGPYLTWLVDRYGSDAVIALGAIAALYFICKNSFLLFEIYYRERVATASAVATGKKLMRSYLHAPYSFHLSRSSALIMRDLESSVETVFRTVLLSTMAAISELFIVLGVAGVLLTVEPIITIASGGVIGAMSAIILVLLRKWTLELGARITHIRGIIFQTIQQGLGSIKETRILGRESFFLDQFSDGIEQRGRSARLYVTMASAPKLAMESVMVVGMVLILVLLLARDQSNSSVLPAIGLFAYAGFRIIPSANKIVMYLNNIRFGKAAVDGVYEGFNATITDSRSISTGTTQSMAAPTNIVFTHEVRLKGVSYRYPSAHQDSLVDANLEIPKGSSIGIVGVTGAGKTTLVDILLGLLRPDKGRLLVDGKDVTDDPRAWQRKIGYVPQTIYLTDDSIAANIALGVPTDEIDSARLRQAAAMAQILDFIDELPAKFETIVGERGVRLSGGQRQRIGVARALYHDPDLLVFDEATSALDNETEAALTGAIARLSSVKTVVLIAHRLSTLRSCRTLVVMKEGCIVATGDYDTLLQTSVDFRRLADLATHAPLDRPAPSPDGNDRIPAENAP